MKKILRFLIRSFVVYLAISFLVITPALYFGLGALYEQQTGRTVDYRMAGFNPFSISVYLYDAYDRNDDNSIFWGIEALSLNLSLQSVGGALVFDSIRLDGLQLNPVITAEGVWNFEEILAYRAKQFSPKNEPENSPASVDIIIKRLFLSSRKLSFSDYSHPANYHVELNRFDVDIREFSTSSPEGRPYHLLVRNEDGGELTIDGLVSVHDAFADVKVDLQCLNLETAWRYLEPSLAFRLRSGCLSTQGVIHVSWAEELLYRVQATRVSLKQLDLENRAESFRPGFHDSLVVEELTLSAINFDTESMLLDIAAIKLDGLAIGSSSKAGAVSLPSMFSVEPKQEAAQQPVREQIARPEPTSSQRSAFSVRLGEINASQTAVTWYFSELGTRPFDVDLDEFVVKNIHWPSDEALELHLVSQINNAAILAADGNIQPESMNLDMTLGLQRFPLAWLNPLIASYADVSVDGGELALETRFQSVAGKDSKGKVTMQGEVSAFRLSALPSLLAGSAVEDDTENPTGIAASDMAENEYFLAGWKKLQWRNVDLDLTNQRFVLGELVLDEPDVVAGLDQQGKLNLDALLKEPTHEEDIASGRASAVEEPVTIAAGPSSVERDFQVIVDSFQIKNGRVSVFDKTVSPPFRLQLKQLQASMSGSNEVLSAGLEGQLNDAAPLALKMEVTDLMKEKNGSVDFSIHHFDMGSLGVYSGRYLGWGIDRGQLNYDMNMQKNVSLLKGKNLLLLDQFQWGKKVESDQQIDVPVKTATALFRGVDGKIVIDVPLEGDISGPDFKLGKFITGAFANLFVKSLASPFTLLASVVNSEEDLASIAFQPGSHAVDESAAMKLHQVAVALEQRPSLNLLVQGAYTAADDLRALKELALARQMQEAGLSKAALLARNEEWQALVAVDCDQLYRKNPERYAACSSDDLDQQFSLVLQAQEVTGEQLQALAGNRALAVKNYLLENEAVPADRVFVKGDVVNDFQGVNLQINF